MRSEIYWIPTRTAGRLAIMPRPRGGDWLEDEVRSWHAAGIDIVLSLLTPNEVLDMDLAQEEELCKAAGIQFVSFPIPDRGVPASKAPMRKLAVELAKGMAEGKCIAIHCRQGLGRAPLVAMCILIQGGTDLQTALQAAKVARGCPVPETKEQERWLAEFASETLVLAPK
jgi:protein-tyrosine phosphatase